MVRTMLRPALALGAVLAVGGYAAADDTLRIGGPGAKSGFGADTLSLVGKGTLADAAADDIELTYYRGGGYRGYAGYGRSYGRYYGGYGRYYGGGYGRYYGGYGRYYGGYRPYYNTYRPYYYRPYSYYRPFYSSYYSPFFLGGYYGGYGGYGYPYYSGYGGYYGGYGGYYGGATCISGSLSDPAQTVPLTLPSSQQVPVVTNTAVPVVRPQPGLSTVPVPAGGTTFSPSADPPVQPVAQGNELQVSLKSRQPAKPYTFKAYGEK